MTDTLQSTTVRNYGLMSMATEAETTARAAWLEAGARYDEDKSTLNLAALIDAANALKEIKKQAAEARMIYKHNHLMRLDGSDNSVKASMIDAGLL